MNKRDEEILRFITVVNNNHELMQVIVTQEIHFHYTKEKNYTKTFRLESSEGPVVYKTENPDIFQLANGTLLKKRHR